MLKVKKAFFLEWQSFHFRKNSIQLCLSWFKTWLPAGAAASRRVYATGYVLAFMKLRCCFLVKLGVQPYIRGVLPPSAPLCLTARWEEDGLALSWSPVLCGPDLQDMPLSSSTPQAIYPQKVPLVTPLFTVLAQGNWDKVPAIPSPHPSLLARLCKTLLRSPMYIELVR